MSFIIKKISKFAKIFIIKTKTIPSLNLYSLQNNEIDKRYQSCLTPIETIRKKSVSLLGFGPFHAHAQTSCIGIGYIKKYPWNDLYKENIQTFEESLSDENIQK